MAIMKYNVENNEENENINNNENRKYIIIMILINSKTMKANKMT